MSTACSSYDLLGNPICDAADLGRPIPDSPHAISVALPLWEHVIGYEEEDPAVIEAMCLGYPRFVKNPLVQQLDDECTLRFGDGKETAMAFPSQRVAQRCIAFVESRSGDKGRIVEFGRQGVWAALVPIEHAKVLNEFWQHVGEIVSSRRAEAALEDRSVESGGSHAKLAIARRISELTGASTSDIYLFPTGMAALAVIQRVLQQRTPDAKSIQLGFPYVDLMKIQEKIGPGFHFFPQNDACDTDAFQQCIRENPISAVFTDLPGNPLLGSAPIPRLINQLRERGIPLVVDETVGSYYNVDPLKHADVVVTSLTKYFSGVSDVMAGALVLNAESPYYASLRSILQTEFEDLLCAYDAVLVAERCRDFETRMNRINATAELLADFLSTHPKVETVYYPKFNNRANYSSVMRVHGGFGGLMSVVVNNAETNAMGFYDNLRVSKGPSLGANYSLACPYTLMAHYQELDYVTAQGVSPYLVRVSVGLEDYADLEARFEHALSFVQ